MELNGRPMGNRILVMPDNPEKISKGGIIIPFEAQNQPQMGTILQVGYDFERGRELAYVPYQRVMFGKYSGNVISFEIGGVMTEMLLMFESDVIYCWDTEESIDWVEKKAQAKLTIPKRQFPRADTSSSATMGGGKKKMNGKVDKAY